MRASLLRCWPASIAASVLLAAAPGLTGCATQTAESVPQASMRVASAQPPPAEEPAPPAKPKLKIAAAKKPSTYTLAAKEPAPRPAAGQDEASCVSVENCASVLKAMVANPDRSWTHRPAAPDVLANGVRLFAYRALRPKLACDDLAAALSEVEAAARTFSGQVANLRPEQVRRVRSLSVEVGAELRAETTRRCAQSKDGPVG